MGKKPTEMVVSFHTLSQLELDCVGIIEKRLIITKGYHETNYIHTILNISLFIIN